MPSLIPSPPAKVNDEAILLWCLKGSSRGPSLMRGEPYPHCKPRRVSARGRDLQPEDVNGSRDEGQGRHVDNDHITWPCSLKAS